MQGYQVVHFHRHLPDIIDSVYFQVDSQSGKELL
jgi:hypothetical protein